MIDEIRITEDVPVKVQYLLERYAKVKHVSIAELPHVTTRNFGYPSIIVTEKDSQIYIDNKLPVLLYDLNGPAFFKFIHLLNINELYKLFAIKPETFVWVYIEKIKVDEINNLATSLKKFKFNFILYTSIADYHDNTIYFDNGATLDPNCFMNICIKNTLLDIRILLSDGPAELFNDATLLYCLNIDKNSWYKKFLLEIDIIKAYLLRVLNK